MNLKETIESLRGEISLSEAIGRGTVMVTVPRAHIQKLCDTVEAMIMLLESENLELAAPPAPRTSSDDATDTYDGWRAKGRGVRKGEKSTGRSADGKATFMLNQTDALKGWTTAKPPNPMPQAEKWDRVERGFPPEDDEPPF